MTGADLKTFVESIVDDSVDESLFYDVVNAIKDEWEEGREWEYLKAIDVSKSRNVGDLYNTMKALPTDYRNTIKLALYEGNNYDELSGLPFEDQRAYKDTYGYFYLDIANDQYGITGEASETRTILHVYKKTTTDIAENTSPSFPDRFHKILGYRAAGYIMGGVDFDEIYRFMSPENKAAALALERAMITWDTNIKLRSKNNRSSILT